MIDLLSHLVDAPLANILILAGLAFIAVGIVGKISGKIEPNTTGRIMSGLFGGLLLVYGIYSHVAGERAQVAQNPEKKPIAQVQRQPSLQPEGATKTNPASSFSGAWRNDNAQTRGITRLEVQQSGDGMTVRAWGACSPRDCDWGVAKGLASGGSASVTWDQGFVLRKMTLTSDGGRLRMALDNVYRDNRPPQQRVEYFVKSN